MFAVMNKSTLVFETTAELKQFVRRRKITHVKIDNTDVTLTAVLNEKDIEIACKEYNARVVKMRCRN